MMKIIRIFLAAGCACVVSTGATAGEINGVGDELPLNGASICRYSGLNDDPTGIDPRNGPPGKTQSYGQDVARWGMDPQEFNPGDICNPNILPMKEIGRGRPG